MSKKLIEIHQEETFNSVETIFEKLDKDDLEWKRRHPVRGYIRDYLDRCFPNGIAGEGRAYYVLQKPWKILRYIRDEVKYAHQRVTRGWDDRAVWSIDYYLARIIPQMIRELQKKKCGIPVSMFDGLPLDSESNYMYSKESEAIAQERWDKILNDIAEGFEEYVKKDDYLDFKKEKEAYEKFINVTFEIFKKNYSSLWW